MTDSLVNDLFLSKIVEKFSFRFNTTFFDDEGLKRNKEGKWKPLISCLRPFFTSPLSNAYPCVAAAICRIQRLAWMAADEKERERCRVCVCVCVCV